MSLPSSPAPEPVEIAAGAFQLLPLVPEDAAELLPVLLDPEVRRWTATGGPGSLDDVREYIDRRRAETAEGRTLAWTIRTAVGGHLAGQINLHHLDSEHSTGEVGFFIAPDHRRQGGARTALSAVTRYAFAGVGLHRVSLIHAIDNTASCAVAQACGFALEGLTRGSYVLHGERVDEHLHARLASDPSPTS